MRKSDVFQSVVYACIMWSILRKILGVICLILGLAALVTPFTPGSWLALIGLELLGMGFLIPKKLRAAMRQMTEKFKARIFKKKVPDPTPISPSDPQEH